MSPAGGAGKGGAPAVGAPSRSVSADSCGAAYWLAHCIPPLPLLRTSDVPTSAMLGDTAHVDCPCRAFWDELAGYTGPDPLEVWLRC